MSFKSRTRRTKRVRFKIKKIVHSLGLPRLTVFRSNRYISAQIIDDQKGETLVSAGSQTIKGKTEIARVVGETLAERALKKGIKKVIFDRGAYKYHGRVKSLAEGARQGGLKF